MKIEQPEPKRAQIMSHIEQTDQLISQLENKEARPCPDCIKPCGCSGSSLCRCDCSENCPFAATQLSSEAGRYPIEPAVLPLVYTMSDMKVCQPCWSCEGHNLEQVEGSLASPKLRRIPQIWFYTDSIVLLRLFDESLSQLNLKKMIHFNWQISATFSDKTCIDCAFALKPDLNQVEKADLTLLQRDLMSIAQNIASQLLKVTKTHRKDLQKKLDDLPLNANPLNAG